MMLLSRNKSFTLFSSLFYFFISILPFLYIPGLYNPFEFPKFLLTITVVYLLTLVRLSSLKVSDIMFIKDTTVFYLIIAFICTLLFADIFGLDPIYSLKGSLYRHQGFLLTLSTTLLFFLIYTLPKPEKKMLLHHVLHILPVQLFILTILSIWQAILFFFFHNYQIPVLMGRIVATFGNPNFLAGYIVVVLPVALYSISQNKKFPKRFHFFIQFLLIVFSTITMLITDSKSALLALMGIGFITLFSFYRTTSTRLFLILIIIISSYWILVSSRYSLWDNRLIIWEEAVKAVASRPLLGYGQENFDLIFPKERHIHIDNAHNIFLETALSSGVIGLGIFVSILYTALKKASFPIKLSLIAFLITAQFNPLSIPQIVLFWILLGCMEENKA